VRAIQAAPAIHCSQQAPLRQSAADHTPEAFSSTLQGRGCRSCSTSVNFCALTTQLAAHIKPSLEHKINNAITIGIMQESVGSSASWNGPQVDCGVPRTGTPCRRPSKGIHKSILMESVSAGPVPGAWLGAIGQLLSAAEHNNVSCSSAHCTGSHQTWLPRQKVLLGLHATS